MTEVRIPAYAKVNLRLDILGKRSDGYHELRTIFQTISLHDTLRIRSSRSKDISLQIVGNPELSSEPIQSNLVYRAVDAVRQELKISSGVDILLTKNIPSGAGLGGGSSDAAAALIGYLRLTRRKLPLPQLLSLASTLGADVPFFLFGGRALGVNKGDEIYPLPASVSGSVLVVFPSGIRVPTSDAYRWLNAAALDSLTKSAAAHKLSKFCALCWSVPPDSLSNDFETAIFQRHPRLETIKRQLLHKGASEALLAGSGSAVFGVFPSPAKARRAVAGFPGDQTFVCEFVSRARYTRSLKNAIVG